MEITRTYEKFPVWIVILANLVSILIYVSGLIIMDNLHRIAAALYLIFVLAMEYKLLSSHCVNCYYFGRICGFGKGRISSFFFKKGDPSKFCEKDMSWKDMIPDLMISLIPLITAIVLMIIRFDFILMAAALVIILLSTSGNALIRSRLTCKFCKQSETCPAQKLFSKDQNK